MKGKYTEQQKEINGNSEEARELMIYRLFRQHANPPIGAMIAGDHRILLQFTWGDQVLRRCQRAARTLYRALIIARKLAHSSSAFSSFRTANPWLSAPAAPPR